MPTYSKFQGKMDILDMIISILKDHEKHLSEIADRFDAVCNEISTLEEKVYVLDQCLERLDGLRVRNVVGAVGLKGPLVMVKCKDWSAFRSASQGALLAAFEAKDDRFISYSISDLFVFTYSEVLLKVHTLMGGRIIRQLGSHTEDGVIEAVPSKTYHLEDAESICDGVLNPRMVKLWLSSELGISEEKVVEGRVLQ
jgi:hypothetical protein